MGLCECIKLLNKILLVDLVGCGEVLRQLEATPRKEPQTKIEKKVLPITGEATIKKCYGSL